MINKNIKCWEVEIKMLFRRDIGCNKKNLKKDIENHINSCSYYIEDCVIKIK